MAQVVITADTDSDELTVTVDGKNVNDISGVSIYMCPSWSDPSEMEMCLTIQSFVHDKDSNVKTYTTIVAADTKEGRDLKSSGAKTFAKNKDFIIIKNIDKVKLDILERFGGL